MIGPDRQPSPDLRAEVAALAAFLTECEKAPDACDEEQTRRLGLAEARERRTLLSFVLATLAGLEVKLAYCAAFCLPAWSEFGAGDEAAVLLKATAEALAKLVG